MQEEVPTKAIAACFGLAAFVIALLAGMIVGNPAEEVLARAVPAMLICTVIGYGIGAMTTKAISDNIQAAAADAAAAATRAAEESARIQQIESDAIARAQGANAAHAPSGAARSSGSRAAVPANTPISTPARAVPSAQTRKAAA